MGPEDCTDARIDAPCGEDMHEDDYSENPGSALGFEESYW